jgi:1,4-alpha-glucan branching enzyme
MIQLIKDNHLYVTPYCRLLTDNRPDQILAFERGNFIFVFNFNPARSFTDYGIPSGPGKFKIMLNTDNSAYGGMGNVDESLTYFAKGAAKHGSAYYLMLYIPTRSALVLKRLKTPGVY